MISINSLFESCYSVWHNRRSSITNCIIHNEQFEDEWMYKSRPNNQIKMNNELLFFSILVQSMACDSWQCTYRVPNFILFLCCIQTTHNPITIDDKQPSDFVLIHVLYSIWSNELHATSFNVFNRLHCVRFCFCCCWFFFFCCILAYTFQFKGFSFASPLRRQKFRFTTSFIIQHWNLEMYSSHWNSFTCVLL